MWDVGLWVHHHIHIELHVRSDMCFQHLDNTSWPAVMAHWFDPPSVRYKRVWPQPNLKKVEIVSCYVGVLI
jgi:hypothetical protein